ncbi:MAG: hypothetical protein JXA30_10395 [Deltaproteobacteria bacterium]|nr:hypothetical protein [Deltaproteobacteria bacterium]
MAAASLRKGAFLFFSTSLLVALELLAFTPALDFGGDPLTSDGFLIATTFFALAARAFGLVPADFFVLAISFAAAFFVAPATLLVPVILLVAAFFVGPAAIFFVFSFTAATAGFFAFLVVTVLLFLTCPFAPFDEAANGITSENFD